MQNTVDLYLLINEGINDRKIQKLIHCFRSISGLSPDIFISRNTKKIALKWSCENFTINSASLIHIVMDCIYTKFFNLIFSIGAPFTVYSTGSVLYLTLLGAFIPSNFPIELIKNKKKFINDNELVLEIKSENEEISFYPYFQKYCDLCFLIIDDILSSRCRIDLVMPILAIHYQATYALLQTLLFSKEEKPHNWDMQFFKIIEEIKRIKAPNNNTWLSMIHRLD